MSGITLIDYYADVYQYWRKYQIDAVDLIDFAFRQSWRDSLDRKYGRGGPDVQDNQGKIVL